MGELANYSIETDQVVLLSFKDGRHLRVPVAQLPRHLASNDLEKVRDAIKLRRNFIRDHMPKAVLVLVAGGLLALLLTGGRVVAQLIHPAAPAESSSQHTGIVRSFDPPTPAVSSAPQPKVLGSSTVALAGHKRPAQPKRRPAPASPSPLPAATIPTPAATPTPLPSPSPDPVATTIQPSPTPTPDPSPQPTIAPPPPDQGQVLGDSTGPGDPPAQ